MLRQRLTRSLFRGANGGDERNTAAVLPFSVTMTSVWELPYLWMCSTASCKLSTTSTQHCRSLYSVRRDLASDGLKVR